jgi:putative tryptophan/tyrosine transport system substrate-binding protein
MTIGIRQQSLGNGKKLKLVPYALCAMLFALCFPAEAQQPKSVPRIGYLSSDLHPADSRAPAPHNLEAFRQGLWELGYTEGKNIIIEYRYADGRLERLPALAEELVRLKVDIIVADTSLSARAAKKATSTMPIVLARGSDPVQSGLVISFARPGGNVTGLTNYSAELLGKRLELLKEVVPKVSRFAFLDAEPSGSEISRSVFPDAQAAAQTFGVKLQLVEVKAQDPDIDGAFRVILKERIGGLITGAGTLGLTLQRKRILELAEQTRIPAIYPTAAWVDSGGLMYYGANNPDLFRRAASYVDKILKGAKPADLPVEQPTKFELVINLKTAKQIGLTIPPNVLARADRVIK